MARNDDSLDDEDRFDEDRDVDYADYDEDDELREGEYREGYEGSAGYQEAVTEDRPDREYAAYGEENDSSWMGIALALVGVGAVLFFFPEPLTSSLGVLLVVAGVGLAVVDLLT